MKFWNIILDMSLFFYYLDYYKQIKTAMHDL